MPKKYRLDRLEMPDIEAMEPKLRSKVMRQAVRVVALRARQIVPVRSGKLKKSLSYGVLKGGLTGKVNARAKYAPHAHLVHDGTRPHDIRAKTPEAAQSAWRFYHGSTATVLHHPGARANPFLLKAAEDTRGEVEAKMREVAEQVLAEVAEGR